MNNEKVSEVYFLKIIQILNPHNLAISHKFTINRNIEVPRNRFCREKIIIKFLKNSRIRVSVRRKKAAIPLNFLGVTYLSVSTKIIRADDSESPSAIYRHRPRSHIRCSGHERRDPPCLITGERERVPRPT